MAKKRSIRVGRVNDSMADLLEEIEDRIEAKTAVGRKQKKQLEDIDARWDDLLKDIVSLVRYVEAHEK